jgi:ubiquinol-cytochrome c reductase iron-sulfur subunit
VTGLGRWLLAGLVLLLGRRRPAPDPSAPRLLPRQEPSRRAESLVLALLALATAGAAGFIVVYTLDSLPRQTQLLGLSLGVSFSALAAAAVVAGMWLVPVQEESEEYPEPRHEPDEEAIEQLVAESGERVTRRRLLKLAAGGAGATLGAALVVPAVSLGPLLDTRSLRRTPWRRGLRLVDSAGRPLHAEAIEPETFTTAFPEGADPEQLGAPLVVVRLEPATLHLPDDRREWAPEGILAYSKICTHAGCAVSLYRAPLYEPTSSRPALICPCHYSTFDPARAGKVLFGPAGRPLPQLPLLIDSTGELRAGGGFSGPVGPSRWGVRS